MDHRLRGPGCIGLDHHLVKVIALGTLKRAAVEPRARGHDAREHHISMALWASGAVGVNVDLMRQGAAIRHDASP